MNGIHDLGGMDNFGPILAEKNEPVFHADWERKVYALTIALLPAGYFNVDEVRRTTEMIPPADYLQWPYYQKWFATLESILLEKDVLTEEEIKTGRSLRQTGGNQLAAVSREMIQYAMTHPMPARVDMDIRPKFKAGDKIRTKNIHPLQHTRLPRYVRGKCGTVELDHGVFRLPDTNAHGGPEKPQHVYSVAFRAREIWGDAAPAGDSFHIDLFDDYMEPLSGN